LKEGVTCRCWLAPAVILVWTSADDGVGARAAAIRNRSPSPRPSPASGEQCLREYDGGRLREREKDHAALGAQLARGRSPNAGKSPGAFELAAHHREIATCVSYRRRARGVGGEGELLAERRIAKQAVEASANWGTLPGRGD